MRKVVIGCLGGLILVGIGAGIATYYAYRSVRATLTEFVELRQLADLDRAVENTTPFEPPADGRVTADRVERLVRVQRDVRNALGPRFREIAEKYGGLAERFDRRAIAPGDVGALLGSYRDLAQLLLDAKRAQIAAINRERLSIAEYRWIKYQTYLAAGVGATGVDPVELLESVRAGRPWAERHLPEPTGSAATANAAVVAPFRESLLENLPLAFFGL